MLIPKAGRQPIFCFQAKAAIVLHAQSLATRVRPSIIYRPMSTPTRTCAIRREQQTLVSCNASSSGKMFGAAALLVQGFINGCGFQHFTTHILQHLYPRIHSTFTFHNRRFLSLCSSCNVSIVAKMDSHQSNYDSAKGTMAQKTDDTKNYGAEKTGQAQEHAHGMGDATKQKAGEAKDSTGNVMHHTGEKMKEGWENTKNTVTGNK